MTRQAVPLQHSDAALSVACQYLKDQHLHGAIREQGGAMGPSLHLTAAVSLLLLAIAIPACKEPTKTSSQHAATCSKTLES